ncbi:MAG: DUF86 domain-containing protein [Sandaracinaceae bacterium]|nr:DUF86 domain-containing protein [Sandaracinaceae bacterium]MBK7773558.1 DUF86 domain-containing protein [Sandaracinaceae bacterium]
MVYDVAGRFAPTSSARDMTPAVAICDVSVDFASDRYDASSAAGYDANLDANTDLREERFVVHTLQLAIQAALDVAFHLISEEGLGEPRSNSDAFAKLAEHGLLAATRATEMARMADFRNVVVHGYEVVDLRIVRDVVENHLGDLESYVADVDAWLSRR